MQEIIYTQQRAAAPMTGKTLLVRLAGAAAHLAIAQMAVQLLVQLTGVELLSLLFYLDAARLAVRLVREAVSSCAYTLGEAALVLERRLGDSTTMRAEIELARVVSLRPLYQAEDLAVSYRRVTHADPASQPTGRVRAAFAASLLSDRLARLLAGRGAQDVCGYVIAYETGRACTFCPDETMLAHLQALLGERYGFDERMTRAKVRTLYARALERAFPALYRYVDPLISRDDVDWARAEIARQKAERRESRAKNAKKTKDVSTIQTRQEEQQSAQGEASAPRRRRKQG